LDLSIFCWMNEATIECILKKPNWGGGVVTIKR
jgi:hypothetical protein